MKIGQDVRFALRRMRAVPHLSLFVVAVAGPSLGLAIAAFAVAQAVVLRPLPFGNAHDLVVLKRVSTGTEITRVSFPELVEWSLQEHAVEGIAGIYTEELDVRFDQRAARIRAAVTTTNAFSVLQIQPILGRAFQPADGHRGAEPVVVITESLWRNDLGGRPDVLGTSLRLRRLDGLSTHRIVGVVADAVRLHQLPASAIYLPDVESAESSNRFALQYLAIARIPPNRTPSSAGIELTAVAQRLAREISDPSSVHVEVVRLHTAEFGDAGRQLKILGVCAALILVMAWINVVGLLLNDGTSRVGELGVRRALGASWSRTSRMLLTEYGVLAVGVCITGSLIAAWATPALVAFAPAELPRIGDLRFDGRVVGFALGLAVLGWLGFGVAPSLLLSRESHSRAGVLRKPALEVLRESLLVAQLTLVLGVLIASALVTQSFVRLLYTDLGFQPDGVIGAEMTLGEEYWRSPAKYMAFQNRIVAAAQALPGTERASLAFVVPPFPEGYMRAVLPNGQATGPVFRVVDTGYFEVMKIPLLRGRDFPAAGNARSHFVMVNRAFAFRHFGRLDVVGERLQIGPDWRQITAVVGDVREEHLEKVPAPAIYLPFSPPTPMPPHFWLVVRSTSESEMVVAALRDIIAKADPALPVAIEPLNARISEHRALARFYAVAMAAFAGLAFLLCGAGVFATVSQRLKQRAKEFSIRIALGASPEAITWLVVRRVISIAAGASLLGLGCGSLLAKGISSVLPGVERASVGVFAAAALTLYGVMAIAVLLALRSGDHADPIRALRTE